MTEKLKETPQQEPANTTTASKPTPTEEAAEQRKSIIQDIFSKLKPTEVEVELEGEKAEEEEPTWEYFRKREFNSICPSQYREIDFNKLPCSRECVDKVYQWFYTGGRGLILHGDYRSGKTRLAWHIVKREFMANRSLKYFFSTVFTDKASEAHAECKASRFYEDLKRPDILFIDDLGKGRITHRAAESLFSVIDFRISEGKPTIMTTNFVGETLKGRIDDEDLAEALIHRMRECFDMIQIKKQGKK